MTDRDDLLLARAAEDLDWARGPAPGGEGLLAPNGTPFAMVEGGRPALRIPDPEERDLLLARGGVEMADAGERGHWILLPDDMLDEPEQVREWVLRAHALALEAPARGRDATPREREAARARVAADSVRRARRGETRDPEKPG